MRLTGPRLPRALRFVGALALALAVTGLPPMAAGPAEAAAQSIKIRDNVFDPATINVAVGDTVTWTNQDQVPHTATSDQRDVFQSGPIAPGASFSQTFTTAGEFAYHCEFHPNMHGTIVVK